MMLMSNLILVYEMDPHIVVVAINPVTLLSTLFVRNRFEPTSISLNTFSIFSLILSSIGCELYMCKFQFQIYN